MSLISGDRQILGQVGVVRGLAHFGAVVMVGGCRWVLNPLCVEPAPDEEVPVANEGKAAAILHCSLYVHVMYNVHTVHVYVGVCVSSWYTCM